MKISKGGSEDPDPLFPKGGSEDPDPLYPTVDTKIWIRIHVKMRWIRNPAFEPRLILKCRVPFDALANVRCFLPFEAENQGEVIPP